MKKSLFAAGVMYLLLYLAPLGVRPLIIPDEARYAEIPREMIAARDWIVPHLNGLRYFEKPVLGYWLTAVSMLLFGENDFAVRLPSALTVGGSSLLIFLLVRRFTGQPSLALFSAVTFFSYPLVLAIGVYNVLDNAFSMFLTAVMFFFFYAYREETTRKRFIYLVLMGVSLGLAFLTKGFVALAVPLAGIIPFLIWERRGREISNLLWVPIVLAVLIVLPWGWMIHNREKDFWNYFFWVEHIQRFMSPDAQHAEPFWFFIPILAAGALTSTVMISAIIRGLKEIGWGSPLARFATCWFLFTFLFFCASRGKLGTYILPVFPALAILSAAGLTRFLERGNRVHFRAGATFLAIVAGILLMGLIVIQTVVPAGSRIYRPSEWWKWVWGAAGLLTWIIFLVLAERARNLRKKLAWYCAGPLFLMFSVNFILPDLFLETKAPGDFFRRFQARVRPDSILVSDNFPFYAICWYYKRNDVYLLMRKGELEYGLSYADSKHRFLSFDQLAELVRKAAGKRGVLLVLDAERFWQYRPNLPPPIFERSNAGFVFAQY